MSSEHQTKPTTAVSVANSAADDVGDTKKGTPAVVPYNTTTTTGPAAAAVTHLRADPKDQFHDLYAPITPAHIGELGNKSVALWRAATQVMKMSPAEKMSSPLKMPHCGLMSLALQVGCKKVTYNATVNEAMGNAYFWITDLHAARIGQALRGTEMEYFGLEFTRMQKPDGYAVIADAATSARTIDDDNTSSSGSGGVAVVAKASSSEQPPTATFVKELCIAHKSEDEETPASMASLAYLVTKLQVEMVHIWCGEFQAGAVERFASTLVDLKNTTLLRADICDVTQEPPTDEIHNKLVEELCQKNLVASGRSLPQSSC